MRIGNTLVAGVGPGLGAAIVRRFHGAGCHVAALARSSEFLEAIADEVPDTAPYKIFPFPCDLSQPESIAETLSIARKLMGPIHTLIYNASHSRWTGLLQGEAEDFESTWRISTFGAWVCAKHCVEDMLQLGEGNMLFTGATSSMRGKDNAVAFSSAKFALRGMADSIARELWPRNIHVAHILVDGMIASDHTMPESVALDPSDPYLRPDDMAESYFQLAQQPPTAWTFEIELRPRHEDFFV